MEDTVTSLSSLVCSSFTCPAVAVIIETVVRVGRARAKLEQCTIAALAVKDSDCIAH